MSLPNVCIPRIPADVAHVSGAAARIALLKARKWPNGSQLKVAFSGGDSGQRKKVQETYEELMQHANLDFVLAKQGQPAEIRITFDPRGGAWSFLGTDSVQQPKNKASMNLGFDQHGTYMHEFGHAVGAPHEHQRVPPEYWNKAQVKRDLSGPPNNWDEQTIQANMFDTFAEDQLIGSVFDPRSIMLYQIPRKWLLKTWPEYHEEPNAVLSPLDKQWLRKNYPGRPGGDPEPNPPVGEIAVDVIDLEYVVDAISRPGERDLFKFVAERAGRYRIKATGEISVVIQLFGPNSPTNLIDKKDNVQMPFDVHIDAALNPGTYYAQVSHADPSGTGKYKFRVIRFAEQDEFLNGATGGGNDRVIIASPTDIGPGRYGLTKL